MNPTTTDMTGWPEHWGIEVSPDYQDFRNFGTGRVWIGDNGAFNGNFEEKKFDKFLEKMKPYQDNCKFIVCPDEWGNKEKTMVMWKKYSSRIAGRGFPVAFAIQDNQKFEEIPDCDAIFIGGGDEWRASRALREIVLRFDKWVHVGRVNTQSRIHYFDILGVDSVDGTCLNYGLDANYPKLNKALIQKSLLTLKKDN